MALAVICALSVSYCCVLFLKKIKHKIAVLFSVDALVLAALFINGLPAALTAAFILSAAAANVTVFFMPGEEDLKVLSSKDFAVIAANIAVAAFAAVYLLKNPQQAAGNGGALNPSITAFLFMVFSVTGYFIGSAGTGGEK
jgi:hypothetical protein